MPRIQGKAIGYEYERPDDVVLAEGFGELLLRTKKSASIK